MRIIYLIDKKEYLTKMSRVRFHCAQAISKLCDLKYWGINWEKYDGDKTVKENLEDIKESDPDFIIIYKPLLYKGLNELNCKKILIYNEMYEFDLTRKEINESGADIVICHHENDYKFWKSFYNFYSEHKNNKVRFYNIPHSAEKSIFYKRNVPIKYDLLLCGRNGSKNRIGEYHYPLRDRMYKILMEKMSKKWRIGIIKHPGYVHDDSYTDKYLNKFAEEISTARICITCSGKPKSRFGKYVEIPMCHGVIAADIPDEDEEEFRKFVIELDMKMSDEEIIARLEYYLRDEDKLKYLREIGYNYSKNYTMEKYAERFFKVIKKK
jgi:hypothetical protein